MAARIQNIQHVKDFDKILDGSGSGSVSVVLFLTSWAEQCQQMLEVMKELSLDSQFNHIKFITVEAEDFAELSLQHQIAAVPTTIFLKNKEEVHRIDGVHAAELTSKVRQFAAQTVGVANTSPAQKDEDLNGRLKKLIIQAPVMLFMKGSPDQPRCGFSRQIIQILKDHDVRFSHFDILSDEEVRQGLKKLSDWPTYPQLYVNGELLGGLDIVKEMVASGEFKDAMPKEESLADRLNGLINQSDVMLFMKGNKTQPKCGFSRQIIDILNESGVAYQTFDILEDQEVRQGLKTYSDWPTYPQLYVKGDLIGGLDIVKEMKETGDLLPTLNGE